MEMFVPSQTSLPRQHFKPYHQHSHLLFQFIFSEVILAHEEMHKIALLQDKNALPERIEVHLAKLSGGAMEYMRLFSWNDDSILAKLKNYCHLFLAYEHEKAKEMSEQADKAWLLSFEAIGELKKGNLPELNNALSKLNRCLKRIAKLALQMTQHFQRDENVIFFLMRNQEKLDMLYGRKFTKKLLLKMFPDGLEEVQAFLIKKYSLRNFDHLIPLIRKKIIYLNDI
jgi:hypothetical protein